MTDPRTKKRILIISVYLVIPLFTILSLYFLLREERTCFDGKKNQNEKGVDCGGVCSPCFSISQDILIKNKEFVFGGEAVYDGLVEISNPNMNAGASEFSYKATLKDEQGSIISEKSGKSFILPSETKHIAIPGFEIVNSQTPKNIEFEITGIKWTQFTKYQKPNLTISKKNFEPSENGVGGVAYGIIKNESIFNFAKIKAVVVLRDYNGDLVAANSTEMGTVSSRQERDFSLLWPYKLPGEVADVFVEVEADTYSTENFIKTYIK